MLIQLIQQLATQSDCQSAVNSLGAGITAAPRLSERDESATFFPLPSHVLLLHVV